MSSKMKIKGDMVISIVIPVFNVELYLEECVQMVLRQTYHNIEIILVDDGSKDTSSVICDRFAQEDNRVNVIHKENGGLSDARNVGLNAANGQYILFLDSDDVWNGEDFLTNLVMKVENENKPDMVMFRVARWRNNKIDAISSPYEEEDFCGTPVEIFRNLYVQQRYQVSACSKMLKLSVLKENGVLFTKGLLGEDMDWTFRLWPHIKSVSYCNQSIYYYRVRPNSITTTYAKKNAMDFCSILEKWLVVYECSADKNRTVYLGYLANLYVTLLYNYLLLKKEDRCTLKQRIIALMPILDYSVTSKSKRIFLMRRLLGKYVALYLAAWIGYVRKTKKLC